MHKFDYSFLKNGLDSKYIKYTNLIIDLKSKEYIRKLQYEDTFKLLNNRSLIDSSIASLRLDDINISDKDVDLLRNAKEPNNQNSKELFMYKDCLSYIQNNLLDLDEYTIRKLHKTINPSTFEINEYRFDDTYNVSNYMQELVNEYKRARLDEDIPNLLLIPCFIVDLLNVKPFSSGNGRTSRLIMNLLLYSFNYDISKFISIDQIIYEYRNNYYDALKESSYRWDENQNYYDSFIFFFLQVIYKAYYDLDNLFSDVSLKKAKKKDRIYTVIKNSKYPLSKKEILDKLPDVSIRTIDVVLANLIKEFKIKKIGTYKDAKYIVK